MVFSSSLFLLYFFPVFLIIYYLLPFRFKNIFTLIASILFYSWGAPDFIFIVLGSIVADFYIVEALSKSSRRANRRILLGLSIVINIGLLVYFKYFNFFIDNLNGILTGLGMNSIHWMYVALPIGISFFTFQKLTYSIDVYRKVHAPLKKVTDYAMYILMFPQLIAGPIVRFNEIADQIEERRQFETLDNRITGFFRFVIGLSKKVLIANVLGEQVDKIFGMPGEEISSGLAWTGIIAYAFQIYYDFSGYSDMAIGIGRMLGFKFPENFNSPYVSQSITEFWRRWHITLGTFMRDYLYIPLGGSRVSTKRRLFFNLWFVFLISGLWHGAAWTFVFWGAFHGLFLILDRLFLLRFYKFIGKVPSIIITFVITLVGWVFFRAETMTYAFQYLESMFAFNFGDVLLPAFDEKFYTMMVLGFVFAFWGGIKKIESMQESVLNRTPRIPGLWAMTSFSVIFFIISLSSIASQGFNPFIYFRF